MEGDEGKKEKKGREAATGRKGGLLRHDPEPAAQPTSGDCPL